MPLYLVATPIGNLEDMTLRAIRILGEVDVIACEDTRHTGRLLAHFQIKTPTVSYHEHNERRRAEELVERLAEGESVAIVTDAGTPGISDPAYRVVVAAIEREIQVIPIPGASALILGLIASGLPSDSFFFVGFLPPRRNARRARLAQLKPIPSTLVLYEAPHRIRHTLSDAAEILGDRAAALGRELTKMHEEFVRGTLSEIWNAFAEREPRGEMTLVIAPGGDDNLIEAETGSLTAQIERLMEVAGLGRNEALKQVATSRGMSKKDAYRLLVEESNAGNEPGTSSDRDS